MNPSIQAPLQDVFFFFLTNIGHDYRRAMVSGALGEKVPAVIGFMIERGLLSVSSDNLPVPTDGGIRWFSNCIGNHPEEEEVLNFQVVERSVSLPVCYPSTRHSRNMAFIPDSRDHSRLGIRTDVERPHVPRWRV
jgi:hypothetical protein